MSKDPSDIIKMLTVNGGANVEATGLTNLKDAARHISQALEQYTNGDIDQDALYDTVREYTLNLADLGVKFDPEKSETDSHINTLPVPEKYDSALYFYTDDEGVQRVVARVPRYEDNQFLDEEATMEGAEGLAFEVMKLINKEHVEIVTQAIVMKQLVESGTLDSMLKEAGINPDDITGTSTEEDEAALNELLEGVEDEFTRARLRKEFYDRKKKGTTHH